MSTYRCLYPRRTANGPVRCYRCRACKSLTFADRRATLLAGSRLHPANRLLLITVTGPGFASRLQQARWNMSANRLRSDLVRETQRALVGRGKGAQLRLAWGVGWQLRGTPDIHLVVAIPEDHPQTDAQIKAQVLRAIKAVRVLERFELLDRSSGEIRALEYVHRFGKRATQIEIREATEDQIAACMTYLATNARQEPKRGAILSEADRLGLIELESILSQQPDATPKHVKALGYIGRRFGTSQNWGATLQDRKQARRAYARSHAQTGSESHPDSSLE